MNRPRAIAARLCWAILISICALAPAIGQEAPVTVQFRAALTEGFVLDLVAHLRRPAGPGPFPVVVLLHGCSGDWRSLDRDWATRFVSWGYATLAVDSYGPRGIASSCSGHFPNDRILDVLDGYAAAQYLAHQAFADPTRLVLMGVSRGATITLLSVERGWLERLFKEKFRAAIALYPACDGHDGAMTISTLVLAGEHDDWTPAKTCRDMGEGRSSIGTMRENVDHSKLRVVILPHAYHAFDNATFATGRSVYGHWLQYDDTATRAAVGEIRTFLGRALAVR